MAILCFETGWEKSLRAEGVWLRPQFLVVVHSDDIEADLQKVPVQRVLERAGYLDIVEALVRLSSVEKRQISHCMLCGCAEQFVTSAPAYNDLVDSENFPKLTASSPQALGSLMTWSNAVVEPHAAPHDLVCDSFMAQQNVTKFNVGSAGERRGSCPSEAPHCNGER